MIIKKKSLKKQGFSLFFLLSIMLIWNVGVWGKEFPTETFGGKGGTRNYNLDCGPNGIMTGVMSKGSNITHQLLVICRNVNPFTGALGEEFTRGPVGGMGDRDGIIRRCRNGRVVTRLEIAAGDFLHGMLLGCETWRADRRQPLQTPGGIEDAFPVGGLTFVLLGCVIAKGKRSGAPVFGWLRRYGDAQEFTLIA